MKFASGKLYLLIAAVISFAISCWVPMDQYVREIILTIGINIILAVSLNLVNGYTGQFSLGHAGFMAIGAYFSAAITTFWAPQWLGASVDLSSGLAATLVFFGALLAGALLAAVAGLVIGIPSLRLRGDYLAIATLGFGEIIRVIIQNTDAIGGSRGFTVSNGYTNFFWTYLFAAITIYVVVNLVNSAYGRGFLAVRDDEVAAEAIGVNTTKYKVIAFVLAAFFAGIAGGLYSHFKQYLHPDGFSFLKSIEVVVMVILGGMGSTGGVIAAAVFLSLLPEALRFIPQKYEEWFGIPLPHLIDEILKNRMLIYSLLLIILMLTRPQGIFGGLRRPAFLTSKKTSAPNAIPS
ncbi:MAG TPA: branched-chain amino acid ABC transporter permease [Chthoniobacterales bacterium]|nr:branched-chain amino acid ABC transporter permease [Chthoniobacterales bacterium]